MNFIEQTLNNSTQRMEMSETVGKLFSSIALLQSKLPIIGKNAVNPHFKNTYADLSAIIEVVNASMSEVGLSYSQIPTADSQNVTVTTIIVHGESGVWIRGSLSMIAKNAGPQSVGSTITYCRRYALQSLLGLGTADEDDDGEMGHGRSAQYANNLQYFNDITAQLFTRKTDVAKWLQDNYSVKKAEELTEDQLLTAIKGADIIGTQRTRFVGLTKELSMKTKEVVENLKAVGGVDSFARLSPSQRDSLLVDFTKRAEAIAEEEVLDNVASSE